MRIPAFKETLARKPLVRRTASFRYVKSALMELGVTSKAWPRLGYRAKRGSSNAWWNFWADQSDHQLYELLYRARTNYRKLMKAAHPDKGHDQSEAVRLSLVWQFVLKQFRKHGYEL